MDEDNTKLIYIEYEFDTVDNFEAGQFAPPPETSIAQKFFNWDETFGEVPNALFESNSYTVSEMEDIVIAENAIIDQWIADMDKYERKIRKYN